LQEEKMAIMTLVIFRAKLGRQEQLRQRLLENLVHLQQTAGFIDNTIHQGLDESQLVVEVEHWHSVEAHKQMLAELEASGALAAFMELLESPPTVLYLEPIAGGSIRS
jgi:quinol monooxygenase YgiN